MLPSRENLGEQRVMRPVVCRWCGKEKQLEVAEADYQAWRGGTYIQVAMPYLSPDDRELLISGTCGECWDRIWKED